MIVYRLGSARYPANDGLGASVLANADELGAGEPGSDTRDIGTEWAKSLTTVVLVVASVVIPRNFPRMRFFSPEPFYFDDRFGRARVKK
jgi:hypothetical protein